MEEREKELRKKIESILFAAGNRISIAEIARLCRMSHNLPLVEEILKDLQERYNKDESPLFLVDEGTNWKLNVREKYIPVVQNIVRQAELSKTMMETLATIAYKAPVLQSDIIRIRTNKAYDHLSELEKAGYISREKQGRTKMIRLTQKFYEYFDIPPDQLREKFRGVAELEKAVEEKETEVKMIKKEARSKKADAKKAEEMTKKEIEEESKSLDIEIEEREKSIPDIDLVNEKGDEVKLDTYDSEIVENTGLDKKIQPVKIEKEKLGALEVVDEPVSEDGKKEIIKEAEKLRKDSEEENQENEKSKKEDNEKENTEQPEDEEKELKKDVTSEEEKAEKKSVEEEAKEQAEKSNHKIKEGKRLFEKGMTKDMEKKVDERVNEIVYGKKIMENESSDKEPEEEVGEKRYEEETPERY